MRNHSRCLSFLLSGILSVSLLVPLSSAQAAYDGSIRNLVDRVTVLTESVQTESANEEELAKLDEMQAELEDKADAKEDVSKTETVSMVVTGGTINVRTGPGTNYDKITQVVSGKQVTVVGESNGWYQVTFDSTTGWLLGEYLRDPADLDGTVGAKVVSMAMPFLGTRYRSGGASPNGFDCSGFTMYLYAQLGYSLPHSATAQYKNCGYAVAKSDLQPGDLVFFSDSSHAIGHVGIYIGNGQIIHARYSVGKITIDSLSASYYSSRNVGAKRIAEKYIKKAEQLRLFRFFTSSKSSEAAS